MTPSPFLLDRIMAVMEAAFDPAYGEAWNRRQVADALSMPSTHALVVDGDGELLPEDLASPRAPAGFLLSRHVLDEEELLLIAVMPSCRDRGIGTILINRLFEAARARGISRIYLEMRRGNPALHLYRKLGFEPIGERPNYYRMANGERIDAITFGRSI
ncbi:GNAT family N-acetyltransferase [Erythrobacter tepidarius]|uniref:GNAT family N-acetyltransferase n=1 Tax=Erythrobacter tepidarius TaxID=60454 RepID=UPI000A3B9FD0|nr:GNAT family N-acetyltransferase [Erythrobacter tepidarius]